MGEFVETWPEDRTARLRHLWANPNIPASEISIHLGVSRNAVLGKAFRLGLAKRRAPRWEGPNIRTERLRDLWERGISAELIGHELGVSKDAVWRRAYRLGLKRPRPRGEARRTARGEAGYVPPPISINPLNLTFDQLAANQCRYAVTEDKPFLFCGHETNGTSYCQFHDRLCHTYTRPANINKPAPMNILEAA